MFIKCAAYNQNIDAVELKYLTAYHLSNCKRIKEAEKLIKLPNDELIDMIAAYFTKKLKRNIRVQDISSKVCKRYFMEVYFPAGRDADAYDRHLVSYCMNNKKNDLVTGFLDTRLGVKFMQKKIAAEFYGAERLSIDKVNLVLQLFREETYKHYANGFQNKGAVEWYLTFAFKTFFKCSFSSKITDIINSSSMTIGDGKEEKDLNRIKNDSIQNVEVSFDISNFKQLVKNIYLGSKWLRYKFVKFAVYDKHGNLKLNDKGKVVKVDNPFGIIHYDIFSCVKKQIFEDRFKALKSNPEYRPILSGGAGIRFNTIDINAEGYVERYDENSYDYRNYTTREHVISLYTKNMNLKSDREFFRLILNCDIEGLEGKNNTPIHKKLSSELTNNIFIFYTILKGVKSAKVFVDSLTRNGIDPLAIPSEIFEDPTWIQRVSSLDEYLKLYSNVIELESNDNYINESVVLKHNKALTQIIAESQKEAISSINADDLKEVLKMPKRYKGSSFCTEPLKYDGMAYSKLGDECNKMVKANVSIYEIMKRFIRVIEYFGRNKHNSNAYLVKFDSTASDQMLEKYYRNSRELHKCVEMYNAVKDTRDYHFKDAELLGYLHMEQFLNLNKSSVSKVQLNQIHEVLLTRAYRRILYYTDKDIFEFAKQVISKWEEKRVVAWADAPLEVFNLERYKTETVKSLGTEQFMTFYEGLVNDCVRLVSDRILLSKINKNISEQKYLDWKPEPEDFTEVLNEAIEHSKQNDELKNLLSSAFKIIKRQPYVCGNLYDSLLNTIRCCSVASFIGTKLSIVYKALRHPNSNDLIFMDTMRTIQPLISKIKDGFSFLDIVDFDSNEVAETYYLLNHPFDIAKDGINWILPTVDWLRRNPFEYKGKEILICEPKVYDYCEVETARKMSCACKHTYNIFKEQINFLANQCLPIFERETIEIYSESLLMGEHKEIMMRYAAYIRMYPELTEGKIKVNQSSVMKDSYSLFENEYLMREGKLVTEERNGYLYYAHKSGVAITPDLPITDRKCIISHAIL